MENQIQKFCSIPLLFFQRFDLDHGAALKIERKMSHLNITFDRYASIGTVMHYSLVISTRDSSHRLAHCKLSRLRCHGHSLRLSSYLYRIKRKNSWCSACSLQLQDVVLLLLDCPASEPLRHPFWLYFFHLDLWSRVGPTVGSLRSRFHPSKGVGLHHHQTLMLHIRGCIKFNFFYPRGSGNQIEGPGDQKPKNISTSIKRSVEMLL